MIAATRETASWKALHDLPRSDSSRLITVKIDSRSASDASAAASELSTKYDIGNIDVVLANAGVTSDSSSIIDVSIDQMQNLMDVNTYGPLLLFQAMWPLLSAAPSPKFVVISSIVGSIVEVEKFAFANPAYAMSKLAVSYLVRRLHHENERLIAMAIHPGWTQSDMGNLLAARVGMTEAPVAISVSTDGILSEVCQDCSELKLSKLTCW